MAYEQAVFSPVKTLLERLLTLWARGDEALARNDVRVVHHLPLITLAKTIQKWEASFSSQQNPVSTFLRLSKPFL
jgi:hypothetical protein